MVVEIEPKVTTKTVFFAVSVFSMTPRPRIAELSREVSDVIDGWAKRHDYDTCCFETNVDDITEQLDNNIKAEEEAKATTAS